MQAVSKREIENSFLSLPYPLQSDPLRLAHLSQHCLVGADESGFKLAVADDVQF